MFFVKTKVYRVILLKMLINVFSSLFGERNEFFILNWWSMIFLKTTNKYFIQSMNINAGDFK